MKTNQLLVIMFFILISCVQKSESNDNNNTNNNQLVSNGNKTACGIDISEYQKSIINYLNKQNDSLDFIICKATEGIDETDSYFKLNWDSIPAKGFIRGCYHFYHCEDKIIEQADNYINTVGQFAKTDFPPIVDFEEGSIYPDCTKVSIQNGLLNFLKILETKTGRKPILYTDNDIADQYINNNAFSQYALWISNPSKGNEPLMPKVWESAGWMIWQKSWKYVAVTKDTCDFDVFNGDRESLVTFIKNY